MLNMAPFGKQSVDRSYIERVYSGLPFLKPPPHVFIIKNADIGANQLYHATHRYNAEKRAQHNYAIYGMYQTPLDYITLAGDALPTTPVHELVHFNGVLDEFAAKHMGNVLTARALLSPGIYSSLMGRKVHYDEFMASPAERDAFLASLHLSSPDSNRVELVHLVYTP